MVRPVPDKKRGAIRNFIAAEIADGLPFPSKAVSPDRIVIDIVPAYGIDKPVGSDLQGKIARHRETILSKIDIPAKERDLTDEITVVERGVAQGVKLGRGSAPHADGHQLVDTAADKGAQIFKPHDQACVRAAIRCFVSIISFAAQRELKNARRGLSGDCHAKPLQRQSKFLSLERVGRDGSRRVIEPHIHDFRHPYHNVGKVPRIVCFLERITFGCSVPTIITKTAFQI